MCFITVDTYRLGNINRFIATCSLGFCQLSRDRLTLVVPLFKLGMDLRLVGRLSKTHAVNVYHKSQPMEEIQ